jgi:hypothetical protein
MKKTFKLAYRPGQQPSHETPRTVTLTGSALDDSQEQLERESRTINRSEKLEGRHRGEARRSVTGLARSEQAKSTEDDGGQRKTGAMTRKTIEVPEDYFFLVKMHALKRRMKEKDMWAEILAEYFTRHQEP